MARKPNSSAQTIGLLAALAAEPSVWRHGYDLSRETGLKSGTLYPILMRLTEQGWLETRWEETAVPGRPPRHLYRLTADGLAEARALVAASRTSEQSLGLAGNEAAS
jgi:DNA-binding PadR family transcriptional regulator